MITKSYSVSGMHCGSCVSRVTEQLLRQSGVKKVKVSLKKNSVVIEMSNEVPVDKLNSTLAADGYLLKELTTNGWVDRYIELFRIYMPIIVVFVVIIGIVSASVLTRGFFELHEAMRVYMASFFLIFSFFKLINLKKFVLAFEQYDVLAKKSRVYAYTYPFLELILGIGYASSLNMEVLNISTFVVMTLVSFGVIKSLQQKQQIVCACLGGFFNLPMSKVALFEDVSMAMMALLMLIV